MVYQCHEGCGLTARLIVCIFLLSAVYQQQPARARSLHGAKGLSIGRPKDMSAPHNKDVVFGRKLLQGVTASPQCLLKVNYTVNSVKGNDQYYLSKFWLGGVDTNVTAWRFGVVFPDGDYIRDQNELIGTDVVLVRNGSAPVFGSSPTEYIAPDNPVFFTFLQSIGENGTQPKPVEKMMFNNLWCSLGSTASGTAVDQQTNVSTEVPQLVTLNYLPIDYRDVKYNGITEFYIKLQNVQRYSSISLGDLKLVYYFHGMTEPPVSVLNNPNAFFDVTCRQWEKSDCNGIRLDIVKAYPDESDAQFAVEITFNEDAGLLLPRPSGQQDAFFDTSDPRIRDELGFQLSLTPNAFTGFALNETLDYSYMMAPEFTSAPVNTTIIPRFEVKNDRIPVYLQDQLIWGVLPESGQNTVDEQVAANSSSYVCVNGTQCEFTAVYCCTPINASDEEISTTIPSFWKGDWSSITIDTNDTVDPPMNDTTSSIFDTTESSIAWVVGLVVGLVSAVLILFGGFLLWRSRRRNGFSGKGKKIVDTCPSSPRGNRSSQDTLDTSDLSWVIPIHRRLGSDVVNSDMTITPISSQRSVSISGALLKAQSLPTDTRLTGNSASSEQQGMEGLSPKSPSHPSVFGYSGVGPLPPNVEQLVDSKCLTISSRINCSSSEVCYDDDMDVDEEFVIEDWQLKRNKSWDGFLHTAYESDSKNAAHRIRRRRQQGGGRLNTVLPPLSPLPPPMFGDDETNGIDLHIPPAVIEKHLGKCLGTGGFGAVYEGKYKGKPVAVKKLPSFVRLSSGDEQNGQAAYEALIREIKLASKFDCERLVKVFGACTDDKNKCCLVMELMRGGNLYQRIHDRNRRRLTYIEILQLIHDIAEGLAYLHPFVIHRDLKPQNILLDDEGRAKIADFGISKVKDPAKSYLTQMTAENGTPMYMSPEQMNGGKVDEKVDVYALGCILNEMYTRRQPWKDSNHFFQIILKVAVNGDRPWVDPDTPEPLKRLIKKCWHQDPHQRPSCAEIMRRTDILIQEELMRWETIGMSQAIQSSKKAIVHV